MALSVYNRPDASFEYPSIATTSEYCIEFWSNTPVPPEVFRQFATAHAIKIENETRRAASDELYEWQDALPAEPEPEALEAKWAELFTQHSTSSYERMMDPRDVPVIARAALMYHNAPSEAYPSEREAVLDYEVELTSGPTTVEELVSRYGTEEIYESVSTMPPPAPSVDQNVIEMLTELKGSLSKLDALDAIKQQNDKTIELQETIALGAQRQMDKMNSDRENALRDHSLKLQRAYQAQVQEEIDGPWFGRKKK